VKPRLALNVLEPPAIIGLRNTSKDVSAARGGTTRAEVMNTPMAPITIMKVLPGR
jgi:hypothetical protein